MSAPDPDKFVTYRELNDRDERVRKENTALLWKVAAGVAVASAIVTLDTMRMTYMIDQDYDWREEVVSQLCDLHPEMENRCDRMLQKKREQTFKAMVDK